MKQTEKIEIIKKAIKVIKFRGNPRCKELGWGCYGCQNWFLYDLLKDYLGLLNWELKNNEKL